MTLFNRIKAFLRRAFSKEQPTGLLIESEVILIHTDTIIK